ncbi:MAG TPA: fumarylacetoacetate hydrolase family protein [Pseudonocardia sp.]|jgi:2,4-diketo-3-deoxy-L-fuconate hydrolase|uniref:fumarylacetoacetate hydrolase family protein n=1 Tax=Pseudonocardia sp. TaxID=60912 RepID=UPI002CFDE82F|nr:fumarylacetoacetate hydrolase family protein [Pseudonocardia sp.]HTF49269.1 fumarylacetoacetate hydrolase family protein [Pseudonocardia sp.]
MRLARYEDKQGRHVGVVLESGKIVSTPWSGFDGLFAEADPYAALLDIDLSAAEVASPDRMLAPVVDRAQIISTGGNYRDHLDEAKDEIQAREPVFFPFLWGAIIGPDDAIVIPRPDALTDYEVELCVVIGKKARHLTAENAMDYVFGYTILNDVSARDVMEREIHQVMLCKSVDTFVPVGPHVVTKDEIADPHALRISTYLNGEIRQDAITGKMLARIPQLLTSLTRDITLYPGDVVSTGTPGGIGYFRDPQEFMAPGDVITAEVERVGRLTNRVVAGW